MPPLTSSLDLFEPARSPKRVFRTNCFVWCLGWLPTSGLLNTVMATRKTDNNVGDSSFIVIVQIIYESLYLLIKLATTLLLINSESTSNSNYEKDYLNLNWHDCSNPPPRKRIAYSVTVELSELCDANSHIHADVVLKLA